MSLRENAHLFIKMQTVYLQAFYKFKKLSSFAKRHDYAVPLMKSPCKSILKKHNGLFVDGTASFYRAKWLNTFQSSIR